ncbi:MAG: pyruvate:ferredoxin (flavodoxin) oxidoreductase [Kiritimatiellae bacterium]|jgi:pyruvate-ferredoxin/flavodoxin oxidoreductase|nr:pyruvate:ferredoxin (flavodoxin) oxidoreductase [Kiritimatiellia bacterium]
MSDKKMIMVDGNTVAGTVAHALSEVCAIYPITPSSPMGEVADSLSAIGTENIWGTIPRIIEMQSEGGAAGAVHGSLTSGAMTATFTASQGLLLMIPNMYKIAGELCPAVFHVAARSLACQGLSIFGDHSDVMAVRQTGFAMLASASVQEAADMALVAHAATLEAKVPFVHFFDGFRTSHEIQKIEEITNDIIRDVVEDKYVMEFRKRGLNPEAPSMRGTAQNPDVYFQGRETVNKYYEDCPAIVQKYMDKLGKSTGRQYKLFDYVGAPDAERIIIIMGSGADSVHDTVEYLVEKGEKVGVIKVRLYRPFCINSFIDSIPETTKAISVLDRTKEPGSIGEPLYQDVRTAIGEAMSEGFGNIKVYPKVVGGRYGLGSKEFTPAMIKGVLDNLKPDSPKNHFTVGIIDDVTDTSIDYDSSFNPAVENQFEGMFYGLGSDGTVGANKNSIKIIGSETDNYAQGYFVYDSKKAGAMTVSHLRFGPKLLRTPYLCTNPDFIACHNFSFVEKYDMLANAKEGATFLLAAPYSASEIWAHLPDQIAQQIIDKKINFYVIDAVNLAIELGLGARINTIMQSCFFKISGILPGDEAIACLKAAIKKTYGKKGDKIVQSNYKAVDGALSAIEKVEVPSAVAGKVHMHKVVSDDAPEFVKDVTATLMQMKGDELPVSKMPEDGTWPTGTTKFEKRNIAVEIPVWKPELCIQCTQCSLVCPHAAIRAKVYDASLLEKAPETFKTVEAKGKDFAGLNFTIQCAPEDCTGCGACVEKCPGLERDADKKPTGVKAINMEDQIPIRETEAANWDFFMNVLPEVDQSKLNKSSIKGSQLSPALFEFSGACAGCGETAYVKLLSQLFGDRTMIANATGCSSIYGGNLPATPYTTRADGCGPVWSNSLFEDNAEFGFGMRLAVDKFNQYALELVDKLLAKCELPAEPKALLEAIKGADQSSQALVDEQRDRVRELKALLESCEEKGETGVQLLSVADYLIKKSVWIVGGDGWAYDIGYGGLDHVLASGENVNFLVLDTEVYSNTGGQASKATPIGAVAKFAAAGKPQMKKDLGMISMTYGNIYVAQVAMGANPAQVVKAFMEAEAYDGPSIILAYSHCISHGINMTTGLNNQKEIVESGHWPLYRFNPAKDGNPLTLDSKAPTIKFSEQAMKENRFKVLARVDKARAEMLLAKGDAFFDKKYKLLENLAAMSCDCDSE